MIMLILDSPSDDPRFNIAAEEYLLKETEGEYAFFYINTPSIIIGKHQNAWAEINLQWTGKHKIPVIRRISGGGTVWHDTGNLNFSFILNGEEGKLVNFRKYALPVLEYLKGSGVPAEFGKRNEILVGGLKVSGNAECVHRRRVLHHGTLLFSSNLASLEQALQTDPDRYDDKAVQSVRSKTGNISDFLPGEMDMGKFRRGLAQYISTYFAGAENYLLDASAEDRIEELIRDKYSLWKWNIGYSPRYSLEREWEIEGVQIRAAVDVEKGQIRSCRFTTPVVGQFFPGNILGKDIRTPEELAMHLTGTRHDPEAMRELLLSRGLVKTEWIDIFVEALF
jgi:lipoate-protein ligase A